MYEVSIIIGANASKYWASLSFKDRNGEVHERRIEAERASSRNSNTLQALIDALQILKKPCMLSIYSDSEYLIEPFRQGWVQNWERNEWRNAKGKTVRNVEQWQQVRRALAAHTMKFQYLEGRR